MLNKVFYYLVHISKSAYSIHVHNYLLSHVDIIVEAILCSSKLSVMLLTCTLTACDCCVMFAGQDFDYALWTGDVPPHNIWNQSRSDQVHCSDYNYILISKIFLCNPVFWL